jgi:hypothetical protein
VGFVLCRSFTGAVVTNITLTLELLSSTAVDSSGKQPTYITKEWHNPAFSYYKSEIGEANSALEF